MSCSEGTVNVDAARRPATAARSLGGDGVTDIDARLREDAGRWQEQLDVRPLPEVAVSARPAPRSRWLPLTAAAGVAALVAGVAVGAHRLPASGIDPVTGVRPRPLPTATASGGVPAMFVGVYQRGSGDLGERTRRILGMLSTADGHLVSALAVATSDRDLQLADPSRGPDGDVWFVRSQLCGGRIVRIDARSGRGSVVVNRPRTNVRFPAVSPDGRWLAFRESGCDLRDGANQLVLRDLSTGQERRILPVDARGRAGAVPTPTRLETKPGKTSGGGAIKVPSVPAFFSAPTWSPDSSRLAIVHMVNMASTPVGAGIALLEPATGRQVRRLAAPPHCSYYSAAYNGAGLALGENCDVASNSARSTVVLLGPDLRTVLGRHRLAPCAAYPGITASGDRRQALLITTYVFCGGRQHPTQQIEALQDGRFRTVHYYVSPTEFLDGAAW